MQYHVQMCKSTNKIGDVTIAKRAHRTRVQVICDFGLKVTLRLNLSEHSMWQCSAAKSVNTSMIFQPFPYVSPHKMANPTSGSNWKLINIHRLLSKHVKANFPNGGWEANQQPPRQAADPAAPKLLTGVLDLSSNPNLD